MPFFNPGQNTADRKLHNCYLRVGPDSLYYVIVGNVELNWPKLFRAFSIKFTLIFFMSVFIPHQHM